MIKQKNVSTLKFIVVIDFIRKLSWQEGRYRVRGTMGSVEVQYQVIPTHPLQQV